MAWRNWLVHTERVRIRGILLAALLALGGWGGATAVVSVIDAITMYRQNAQTIVWAQKTYSLFQTVQNFAFERGRTAVVLSSPEPVRASDQAFLLERRRLADESMQRFMQDRKQLPDIGADDLATAWSQILVLRQSVDKNIVLPGRQREAGVLAQWDAGSNSFLDDVQQTAQRMSSHYLDNGNLDLARLTLLAGYALKLRVVLGSEASLIARHVSSQTPLTMDEFKAVYQMRGQEQIIWQEIDNLHRYAPDAELDALTQRAMLFHHQQLQSVQDRVLADWDRHRRTDVSLDLLKVSSQPALDEIAALSRIAAEQIGQHAHAYKEDALRQLWASLTVSIGLLGIMLLAVWYVIRKVIRPLEHLDKNLRQLVGEEHSLPAESKNEIVSLREAVQLIERLWEEKVRWEEELNHLAFHDTLTQLSNRRLLIERIQQCCVKTARHGRYACLIFLDLDKFKPINDVHGHEMGDQVLVAVARRLKSLMREEDTIARLGGDEFVVLIEDLGGDHATATAHAGALREKLRAALARPYELKTMTLCCSASVGYKVFQGSTETPKALLCAADSAMYQVKSTMRKASSSAFDSY